MGKLIVFEGTDCSGKETQTNLIVERLQSKGFKVKKFSYPDYSTPTGKIIAGPYLAKFGEPYFPEGATNVDPVVASLYYIADRYYNKNKIEDALKENDFVILDRYSFSNLAYQGGKIKDKSEQEKFFNDMFELEFNKLGIRKPDYTFFLYMPTDYAVTLRKGREEKADQHEADIPYLKTIEKTYLSLAKKYEFIKINCVKNEKIKTIFEINDEIFKKMQKILEIWTKL